VFSRFFPFIHPSPNPIPRASIPSDRALKGRGTLQRYLCCCVIVIASCAFNCGRIPAWAETAEDLKSVEEQLSEQKAEAARLDKKEKETAQEIGSLQERLVAATEALQDKQKEQEELESRLDELEQDIDQRSAALTGAEGKLGSFTEALIRFRRQPPEAFLLRDSLNDDAFHRALLLRSLMPKLQKETTLLSHELDELERLRQQASKQKRLVAKAQQTLAWQRNHLDQLVKTRQGLLQKTVEEKEALARELEALAQEAKDLGQLAEKVSHSAALPHDLKRSLPRHDLKWPVVGRVVYGFGQKDKFGVTSQGLTLRAVPESPVVAPEAGRVAFAGPFRGYGKIVILQHGGGWHSFLAGFGRLDVEAGQSVGAGEPLGVLPTKGDASPEIYFERRFNGQPVAPVMDIKSRKAEAAKQNPR